jgi:Leucine-rich repeat (LRR) protein
MKSTLYLITLIYLFILTGCETYVTYYGETNREVNVGQLNYRLDLSFKSLTNLPADLAKQTELRMLNLSGNPNLDLPSAITMVCNLPKLHILLLNKLQLKTLPDEIKNCKSLTQLSIVHNPQLNFQQAFGNLASLKLKFIDLSHNELSELPPNLASIKTLSDLRLSHNTIGNSSSYKTLALLPQLFSLWLDNNQLRKLPKEIGLLPYLHYLYLDNNLLRTLPKDIKRISHMRAVWLGHNCFVEIPPILAEIDVKMVFLNNNRIDKIRHQFEKGNFLLEGIILDNNFLNSMEKKKSAQIFENTFIYSDSGQKSSSPSTQCKT